MKIALIGGLGYIGSRLRSALEKEGHQVNIYDLGLRGSSDDINQFELIDYRDLSSGALIDFEAIVVFAGHSSVSQAQQDPAGAISNNVVGMQHLLGIANGRKFIYASSGSVYDSSRAVPATEDTPISPARNPYDLSKYMFDQLASMSSTPWTALRLGTVNGPSKNMRFDLMLNRMVADAMSRGVVQVSNGHVYRAILGIDDLCAAVEKILNSDNSPFGVLNLRSFNATVEEIASSVSQATGASLSYGPSSSTYDFSMSSRKAQDTIGFNPEFDLPSLVMQLVEFYSDDGQKLLRGYSRKGVLWHAGC